MQGLAVVFIGIFVKSPVSETIQSSSRKSAVSKDTGRINIESDHNWEAVYLSGVSHMARQPGCAPGWRLKPSGNSKQIVKSSEMKYEVPVGWLESTGT